MNYKNIKTSINKQLLEIYINRPDKMNAINPETSMELKHIFEQFKSGKSLEQRSLTYRPSKGLLSFRVWD